MVLGRNHEGIWIEAAKTGRAKCVVCDSVLGEGSPRLSETVRDIGITKPIQRYYHLRCALATVPDVLARGLENARIDVPERKHLDGKLAELAEREEAKRQEPYEAKAAADRDAHRVSKASLDPVTFQLTEELLDNPHDTAVLGVLADQLQKQGDPRGELIAVQLALAAAGVWTEHLEPEDDDDDEPLDRREREIKRQIARPVAASPYMRAATTRSGTRTACATTHVAAPATTSPPRPVDVRHLSGLLTKRDSRTRCTNAHDAKDAETCLSRKREACGDMSLSQTLRTRGALLDTLRSMRAWWIALGCAGCGSVLGIDDVTLGDAGNGGGDIGAELCLGPAGFTVCLPASPTNQLSFSSSGTLDTDSDSRCATTQPTSWLGAGQPAACFLIGEDVIIAAPFVGGNGGRPLVVFAAHTITVSTVLDVASHGATTRGAGSPSPACVAPIAALSDPNGASGGAGGSFMLKGGDGARGSGTAVGGRASAADGAPPASLHAGCPGGVGGTGMQPGGAPGIGGGAVYLVAGQRITINGVVNASGGGGRGGNPTAGGGGGGTGGMIVLFAPVIDGTGTLVANGGGGGGGGNSTQGGGPGGDPPIDGTAAVGGVAPATGGGPGGRGAAGTLVATAGTLNATATGNAGGGGGGGIGFVRANVATTVKSSPSITIAP